MTTPTPTPNLVPQPSSTDLNALLGNAHRRPWYQRWWLWTLVVATLLAGLGLNFWQRQRTAAAATSYVTQTVKRGDITLTISANGTLQPTRSVAIGSELSGTVKAVLVDVNDRVKKGQVLVELDVSKLQNQVQSSRAALASAQAQVLQANATVQEATSTLQRMEQVHQLSGGKTPSNTELDSAKANLARAKANWSSAQASVQQAQAALSNDQTNLTKASIRSPIDGVVLSRSVDPGNAVAASLQAVTLFTIAQDLTQLRLEANIDEADVGTVQAGQVASFTVSAYPARRYPATIARVAYGATTTDNVITYKAYLDVDNADLSLRPGMTATAVITSSQRQTALLVPNTALRFTPPASADTASKSGNKSVLSSLMPRPPRSGSGNRSARSDDSANNRGSTRQVWVMNAPQNGDAERSSASAPATAIRPVQVTLGISDGRMTEMLQGDLQEGMQVVTDVRSKVSP